MLFDVIEVKLVKNYILFLRFEDGKEGYIDISKVVSFEGVFSKLKDMDYFATVQLNKELGTIIWNNGADLSPNFLYSNITKNVA